MYVDSTFYEKMWEAATDEGFVRVCGRAGNYNDRDAVAVEMDRKAIGRLPQKVFWLCSFFF